MLLPGVAVAHVVALRLHGGGDGAQSMAGAMQLNHRHDRRLLCRDPALRPGHFFCGQRPLGGLVGCG
jgi:hypothetical protein